MSVTTISPATNQGGRHAWKHARWPALGISLLILGALPMWWGRSSPRLEAGSVPAAVAATKLAAAPIVTVIPDPTAPQIPAIHVENARLADRKPGTNAPVPVRISIAAIGVDATVVPVGVDPASATMQVPSDIRVVGWYRYGSSPGRPGSSILVGHVDSAIQGAGVFFGLRDLRPGTIIAVHFGNGRVSSFRVTGRRAYPKSELPAGLFARSGAPVLTLITCGGAFDYSTHHYADNVVVFAVPTE